ncbi:hypothetical protein VDG05_12545 [Xanthomonas campestris pv. raphani]|uniref:hypothetical protein n=1 Tax=Xanthomonas campestris TaxID=339 RepID=UPI002B228A3F|nr:hypothetical protein [Xanthomonas campestris]MEA9885160.1 hypothetical protein [Xanthomonas campestris pv. raphani]
MIEETLKGNLPGRLSATVRRVWVKGDPIPLSPPQRWRNFLILKKNPGFGFLASVFFSVFRMRLKGGSGTLTQRRPWQEMLI